VAVSIVWSADEVRCRILKTPQDDLRDSRTEPEDFSDSGLPLLLDSSVARRSMGRLAVETSATSFISSKDGCSMSGRGLTCEARGDVETSDVVLDLDLVRFCWRR
jgi:hypothetical protein